MHLYLHMQCRPHPFVKSALDEIISHCIHWLYLSPLFSVCGCAPFVAETSQGLSSFQFSGFVA